MAGPVTASRRPWLTVTCRLRSSNAPAECPRRISCGFSMANSNNLVLGIETSCDDTAVALVDADGNVVSAGVASQALIHDRYGGVYPEMASRAHIDKIIPAIRMVIEDAGIDPS